MCYAVDVSNAFDIDAFNVLFNELHVFTYHQVITLYVHKSILLCEMGQHSNSFSVPNDVKQGGVVSLLLFSCYINKPFSQLQHSGLGCHVGRPTLYAGASGYADDIAALVAPSLQCLKIKITIIYVENMPTHTVLHSTQTSQKLFSSNVDDTDVIPQI